MLPGVVLWTDILFSASFWRVAELTIGLARIFSQSDGYTCCTNMHRPRIPPYSHDSTKFGHTYIIHVIHVFTKYS